MINEFLIDDDVPTKGAALFDVDRIEALVRTSAAKRAAMSSSELLLVLGYRFTRPKIRALCKVLDAVDRRAAMSGEPELAALVVREGDGLPGQGWWVSRTDYQGEWTGPAARRYLDTIQTKAFDYWEASQS